MKAKIVNIQSPSGLLEATKVMKPYICIGE